MVAFEQSCVPHNRCATAANKSLTFTLPKEVSLFAEGDPEEAEVRRGSKVPGRDIRRQALHRRRRHSHAERKRGIQYHAYILVGKFARIGRPPSFGASTVAWRKHGASAGHPAKERVEGG